MRRSSILACLALLFGCAGADESSVPYKPVGDVKQTMVHVLEPAADVIWDSAGTIDTLEGRIDLAPTTDEGWLAVKHSAAVIAETGNLLMMPGRRQDNEDWVEISLGLVAVGEKAMAAADAQDADELFEVGGQIYNVCLSCHQLYWTDAESAELTR